MLELLGAMICAGETIYASRCALEQRYPYRDRRLVEYVLSLPAYQLYYRGYIKYVLRTAMQDILPQMIRTRTQPNRLLSLFFRGRNEKTKFWKPVFKNPVPNGASLFGPIGLRNIGMSFIRLNKMGRRPWCPGYVYPLKHGIKLST